uniref:RF-1 domain peptide chain release factor n=1 Tax=Rhizobium phage LG08 TaxID=3129229 RepID=A0AAU8HYA0_9CAUD
MILRPEDIEINTYSSRPSGLVNVAPDGVSIVHLPTGTLARFHGHKSQHKNRAVAMEMISVAIRNL